MSLSELRPVEILVGPEEIARPHAVIGSMAPRLDYRLVADRCGASIRQWHPSPSGLSGPRVVRLGRSFAGNSREAVRFVRNLPPESIVYSTGETWGLPVALAAAMMRQRRFTHVVYVHRVFSPLWLRFLGATRNLLAVDGWICVTRHQAGLLRSMLGPGGSEVTVVSQGVDTAFFDAARASAPISGSYVLAVGAEMRNYDLFFEAVCGLDVNVIVKVSSAWMTGARRKFKSVPDNVRILTQRLSYVELRDLYAGAGLVVVPLNDTPQAAGITTILESMAMGVPVIATRSRGLPDCLVDGQTGFVVEPTPQALQQAIAGILGEPALASGPSRTGRIVVNAQCSLEAHADAVVHVLAGCVDPSAGDGKG